MISSQTTIALNEEQSFAFEGILDRIWNNKPGNILLTGFAGTGKTTLITELVAELQRQGMRQIVITAPTHKAVKVLRKSRLRGVTYATIHSFLNVLPKPDPVTGKLRFEQDKYGKEIPAKLLIVDEVSMLDDELYSLLLREECKILFVGDPAQIPPVNRPDSAPLLPQVQVRDNINVFRLTEIMRQAADNPILGYSNELRKNLLSVAPKPAPYSSDSQSGIFQVDNHSDTTLLLHTLFCNETFDENPDYAKVLAWTNAKVGEFNDAIRALKFPNADEPIVEGEQLILTEHYKIGEYLHLPTNEEIKVLRINSSEFTGIAVPNMADHSAMSTNIPVYRALCEYENPSTFQIEVTEFMIPVSMQYFNQVFDQRIKAILKMPVERRGFAWREFYQYKAKFAQVAYNYAITVHRSQGSTYENSVLIWDNISRNPDLRERNRILYVAMTRAKSAAYII